MNSVPHHHLTITILHSHMLFSTGGTRFIHELARHLAKKHTVTIVVEKASEEWRKKCTEDGVQIKELGGLSSNSESYWLFFPFILVLNYFKLLKLISNNTDITISFLFPMNLIAVLLPYKHLHYCFEPFAFFYDTSLQKSFPQVKYFLLKVLAFILSPLDKYAVTKAHSLMAINPSVGAHIYQVYQRHPNSYSYLGVDINHFKPASSKPKKMFTVFHSTDYTPLKGTEYLLKAFCYLEQTYADKLTINISESLANTNIKQAYLSMLKKYKREKHVKFLSHVSYKDLPTYYSNSDAYYFVGDPTSSGATAASLSVLEAQACGTPVVRSIGNSDEVIPKVTGFLVNPLNTKQLVAYLKLQVLKPQLFYSLRKAARKHIVTNYTWDKVADRVEKEIALLSTSC